MTQNTLNTAEATGAHTHKVPVGKGTYFYAYSSDDIPGAYKC